jgi:anaerobic ribonucleoside-triphosphate reductase activating protein
MALDREITVQVAQIVAVTEAEGPGRRFALWLQGCPLRCPGCCNPEMLPFAGGRTMHLSEVLQAIDTAVKEGIEGITLLGGEPMAHAASVAPLARMVQARNLSVMVFTGFTLEELQEDMDPAVHELLAHSDILVDGPYRRDMPETRRRWIGSANQRVFFLSSRYRADDPEWTQPNTLEIRLSGLDLEINGFPARQATGIWQRGARVRS